MKEKTKFIKSERRSFLKGAAVAGTAAVIAPTAVSAAETAEPIVPEVAADKGYEENGYIRKYYDLARF